MSYTPEPTFQKQFIKCKEDGTCLQIEEGRTFHCFKFDDMCASNTCKHFRSPLGELLNLNK